jgi:heme-degrading monooxygenase HmoA
MYLTMNRFRVRPGQEDAFEAMWKTRDSHLKSVPGFVSFHLMRGEVVDGATLYASHTLWTEGRLSRLDEIRGVPAGTQGCEIVGRDV